MRTLIHAGTPDHLNSCSESSIPVFESPQFITDGSSPPNHLTQIPHESHAMPQEPKDALTPAEIEGIQKLLGLNFVAFAELLQVNDRTVRAWTAGKYVAGPGPVETILALLDEHTRELESILKDQPGYVIYLPTENQGRPHQWYVGIAGRILDRRPTARVHWLNADGTRPRDGNLVGRIEGGDITGYQWWVQLPDGRKRYFHTDSEGRGIYESFEAELDSIGQSVTRRDQPLEGAANVDLSGLSNTERRETVLDYTQHLNGSDTKPGR